MRDESRKTDLDSLRAAFRAAVDDPANRERRADCVDDDRIWLAVNGELDSTAVAAIVDHMASCPRCAESWRVAASMATSLPAGTIRDGSWTRVRPWLSLAAAAVLVIGIGYAIAPQSFKWTNDATRSAAAPAIESLVTGEALPRDGCLLRWTAVAGATAYVVTVTDDQGRLLHEARNVQPSELTVPAGSLEALPPDSRIHWRVEADLRDGSRVTSKTFPQIVR